MNVLRSLFASVAACIVLRAAPDSPGPLAPLQWMVGEWSAPVSREVHIDLRVEWTANRKALRFDSAWVKGVKVSPYTSGMYAWDPARKVLTITYADAAGTLARGDIAVEGNRFVNSLEMANEDGSEDRVKVILTKATDDQFTNDIQVLKAGSWAPIAQVVYSRNKP